MTWPSVPIERLVRVSGGSASRRNEDANGNDDVPWVTLSDLPEPGAPIIDVPDVADRITQERSGPCTTSLLQPGTVLFSSRVSIGRIGIASVPLATDQGFVNLAPGPDIEPRYLAHALRFFTPQISALAGQAIVKNVSRGAVGRFRIPLPPPSEQRRIVDILERTDALRRGLAEADSKVRRILPALFGDMFGDLATNSMEWAVERLGDIVRFVGGGSPSKEVAAYWDGSIPWVSPRDMKPDQIDRSAFTITEEALRDPAVTLIPANSVLIVVRGRILARTAPIRMNAVPVAVSQDIKALLPRAGVNPFYLRWALQSCHPELLRLVSAAANGVPKIDTDGLSSFPVPVPPDSIQERFAQHAVAMTGVLEQSERAMLQAERLPAEIACRAFSDELTARWRDIHADRLPRDARRQTAALGMERPESPRGPQRRRSRKAASC